MTSRLLFILLGTVVLTVAQGTLSFLTPPAPPLPSQSLWLVLASNSLIAATLLELGCHVAGPLLRRAAALWAVWAGVQVNSLAELLLFDVGLGPAGVLRLCAFGIAVAAPVAVYAAWAARHSHGPVATARDVQPAWLALAPPLYVVLYFIAGMAIWPLVASFYEARPMPPGWLVASVQVVRGFGFGLIVFLMVRMLRINRIPAALAAAAALAVLGGIAPLLIPNPYLPTHVRLAHMPETAISNFLFGVVLGWALRSPARRALEHGVGTARA